MSKQDPREFRLKSRRFEIVRVLGQGGMGVVYEARDREREATVALKMLRSIGAQAKVRLKQEFRALQGIHHPNLVSLGELLEEDGEIFFTMELVVGEDFIEHVRPRSPLAVAREARGPSTDLETRVVGGDDAGEAPGTWQWLERRGDRFDEARLREAFLKLARGIEALHAADKIHRDIKPYNVLVTAGGRVVILDFGVVLDVARGEREGAVVGTAHFMAPEQAAGGRVGPEADWYSVGAMLYLALTGFLPFQLAPEVALDFKQAVEPTPPSLVAEELIPEDLEALCVDLLRLDPAERPTGAEVRRRLESTRISRDSGPSSRASGFIGRGVEILRLQDALVEVSGPGPRCRSSSRASRGWARARSCGTSSRRSRRTCWCSRGAATRARACLTRASTRSARPSDAGSGASLRSAPRCCSRPTPRCSAISSRRCGSPRREGDRRGPARRRRRAGAATPRILSACARRCSPRCASCSPASRASSRWW